MMRKVIILSLIYASILLAANTSKVLWFPHNYLDGLRWPYLQAMQFNSGNASFLPLHFSPIVHFEAAPAITSDLRHYTLETILPYKYLQTFSITWNIIAKSNHTFDVLNSLGQTVENTGPFRTHYITVGYGLELVGRLNVGSKVRVAGSVFENGDLFDSTLSTFNHKPGLDIFASWKLFANHPIAGTQIIGIGASNLLEQEVNKGERCHPFYNA